MSVTLRTDKATDGEPDVLLEAFSEVGVVLSPLSKYEKFNTRICRPIGLKDEERKAIIDYAIARVGMQYDNKQIIDLARYLFPYPPVPVFLQAAIAGDWEWRSNPGNLFNSYRRGV